MKIPCKECISLAICVSQERVVCPDLYEVAKRIISEKDVEKSKEESIKVHLLLPNMKGVSKW